MRCTPPRPYLRERERGKEQINFGWGNFHRIRNLMWDWFKFALLGSVINQNKKTRSTFLINQINLTQPVPGFKLVNRSAIVKWRSNEREVWVESPNEPDPGLQPFLLLH